jgi:hypothetical protein
MNLGKSKEYGPSDQLRFFGQLVNYRPGQEAPLEVEPAFRLSYEEGLQYLQYIVIYGKESANVYQSFLAKFQIEVPHEKNLEFLKTMRSKGCHVLQFSTTEVCDYCGEDLSTASSISYTCICGEKQYHFDCDMEGDFWNHGDHDCFPACCKAGHTDLMFITRQNFFDAVPEAVTYIEEERLVENSGFGGSIYTVTHSRICINERAKIARKEYVALQKSPEMAEAKKRRRMLSKVDDILKYL